MRRLSYKWPVWITVLAFALPGFYIYYRVLKPTIFGTPMIFNGEEFLGKVLAAVFFSIIAWFIYGIACLLTSPLRDVSAEEPWKPSNDFHIEINKDENQDVT